MSKIFKRDQGKSKLGDRLYKLVGYVLNGALGLFFGMFLIGGIVSSITGCSSIDDTNTIQASEVGQTVASGGLRVIDGGLESETHVYFYTCVDPDTMVMYAFIDTGRRDGGLVLTPLYNADGTLKLYDGPLD